MRLFVSISLVGLLLVSCRVQPPAGFALPKPFVFQSEQELLYRASFDYKEYHFSGLCVFKKTEGENIRIVFLNEMGITFMDFELTSQEMVVHKMIDQLDRDIILNVIENDFRQLLMTDLSSPKKVRHRNNTSGKGFIARHKLKAEYYQDKKGRIVRAIRKGFLGVKKATVSYEYEENAVPREIILLHRQIKMNLKLTLLEKI